MKFFATLATLAIPAASLEIGADLSMKSYGVDAMCFDDTNPLKPPRGIDYNKKDSIQCISNVSKLSAMYSQNYDAY